MYLSSIQQACDIPGKLIPCWAVDRRLVLVPLLFVGVRDEQKDAHRDLAVPVRIVHSNALSVLPGGVSQHP